MSMSYGYGMGSEGILLKRQLGDVPTDPPLSDSPRHERHSLITQRVIKTDFE